jgi:peptidoglycan hydrolase-like protein with peptidoglycan-binding domain
MGGTAAGAVVAGAVSAWDNREGLAHGDSNAIGNVTADATVGATSVLAATAAGAAIGSVVPVAGTAVGAVAGFVVGAGITYGAQISGVRDDIAKGVAAGVDELKHLF